MTFHRRNTIPALQPVDAARTPDIRALGGFAGALVAVAGYGCEVQMLVRNHALLSHITREKGVGNNEKEEEEVEGKNGDVQQQTCWPGQSL
jgi:hypothetical protein